MTFRNIAATLGCVSLLLSGPTPALAENCPITSSQIESELYSYSNRYPGYTLAAIGCGVIGADEYETALRNNYSENQAQNSAIGAFEACLLLACIPADVYGDCMVVGNELALMVIILDLANRYGC